MRRNNRIAGAEDGDVWTNLFVKAPYKRLMKTYGQLPTTSSDGRTYAITPQPFAKGLTDSLSKTVQGYEDSAHKNYDGAHAKEALAHAGLAVGLVMDAHSLISPDGKADIGLIPPGWFAANNPGGYGQPSWAILNPEGAMNFWNAMQELTGYLDNIGDRDWSFWETSKAGIQYVFGPLDDAATAIADDIRAGLNTGAEILKVPAKVFNFASTFIEIVSSPITWAVVGGGLILHHLKEEGRKGRK